MSKKIGTMLVLALDPRTPEPEAIAALRALRNIKATTEQVVEALSNRLTDAAPRVRVKATYTYKNPFDREPPFDGFRRWWEQQTSGDPTEDFFRRAQAAADDAHRRASRSTASEARRAAEDFERHQRQTRDERYEEARMAGAMNQARYMIERGMQSFEAPVRNKCLFEAGLAIAEALLEFKRPSKGPRADREYKELVYEFGKRMKHCGDPRSVDALDAAFSEIYLDIMNHPHRHYT